VASFQSEVQCKTRLTFHVNVIPLLSSLPLLLLLYIFRDDEEWLQHRQILNSFLLRDFHWAEALIDATCDKLVNEIHRKINDTATAGHSFVPDLNDVLYRWTIDGN